MAGGKGGSAPVIPTEGTSLADPITFWRNATGTYPGNNLLWWMFKRPIKVGNDQAPAYFLEVFDPGMGPQMTMVNAPAGRGHYILDAFNLNRSAVSGIGGLPTENSSGLRPTTTAFFAGRVWYAGVNSTKFSSRIYYSQIIERDEQTGRCYQAQDPTQETAPELLASDGGVIVAPDIQQVIALFPMQSAMIVLASNGIWGISGSRGLGFDATDFSVSRLHTAPCLSATSVVDLDGSPVWWNRSGIWTIVKRGAADLQVQSLTDQSIATFFQDIPDESKKWAKGAYSKQDHIIQWVYRSTAPTTVGERNDYDTILNFNVLTGAFYPWTVDTANVVIKGIFAIEGDITEQVLDTVAVDLDVVQVTSDDVVSTVPVVVSVDSKFKYIVQVRDPDQGTLVS